MNCRRPAPRSECLRAIVRRSMLFLLMLGPAADRHDRALSRLQARRLPGDENIARLGRRDLHGQDHLGDAVVSTDVDRDRGVGLRVFRLDGRAAGVGGDSVCGYVAIVFFEELDKSMAGVRVLTFFLVRRRFFVRLLAERKAIRNEIIALGKETPIASE